MGNLFKDSFLLYSNIWLSVVFLVSPVIFAEGIGTSSTAINETTNPIVTAPNSKEGNRQNEGMIVAERS